MLRDASHQQVIQKFSFIESLNLSRKVKRTSQSPLEKLNNTPNCPWQEESAPCDPALAVKMKERETKVAAIVATSNISSTISADWYQSDSTASGLSLAEIITSASSNPAENYIDHNSAKNRSYLGKVLFALASSYCLFVLWWIFGHQGNRVLTMLTGGKQIVLSKSDIQFLDYLERSLDNIDRQLEAKKEAAGNQEVVYVPVYTPSSATAQFPQVTANLPLTTSPSANTPSNVPAVTPSKPASLPALKIPAPPPLPAPTPLNNVVGQNNQTLTANKPKVKHTLIGTLDLGEGKSAALVKVKGKTRRIWLGEKINTEGWILESVGNQQAQINYQGQVRSISVGETF